EHDLARGIHSFGDLGELFRRRRRRPEAEHHLVGLAPEDQYRLTQRFAADEFLELRVLALLVDPPDVAVLRPEVPVDRNLIEDAQLAHAAIILSRRFRLRVRGAGSATRE